MKLDRPVVASAAAGFPLGAIFTIGSKPMVIVQGCRFPHRRTEARVVKMIHPPTLKVAADVRRNSLSGRGDPRFQPGFGLVNGGHVGAVKPHRLIQERHTLFAAQQGVCLAWKQLKRIPVTAIVEREAEFHLTSDF